MGQFERRWHFHNCCGAMDGKHVNIRCPPNSGSFFFNYKKTFSVILFAVVDANLNFLYVDVGTNGRVNDAQVFSKSAFYQALQRNQLNVPERGVFVGDDAFPLREDLLKPFSKSGLTVTEEVFNYRLSRARRVVENAFGVLAARFRIFFATMALAEDTIEEMVKASCALHNWIRKTSGAGNHNTRGVSSDTDDSKAHSAAGAFRKASWKSSARESRAATPKRQPPSARIHDDPCRAMAMGESWESTAEIDTRIREKQVIQIFSDHFRIRLLFPFSKTDSQGLIIESIALVV